VTATLFLLDAGQALREPLAPHVDVEVMCDDVEVLFACMAKTMMEQVEVGSGCMSGECEISGAGWREQLDGDFE
jgi:hypothetical protein